MGIPSRGPLGLPMCRRGILPLLLLAEAGFVGLVGTVARGGSVPLRGRKRLGETSRTRRSSRSVASRTRVMRLVFHGVRVDLIRAGDGDRKKKKPS